MKRLIPFTAVIALTLMSTAGYSLAGPGEDTVTITNRVQYLQMPTAPRAVSGSIRYDRGLSDDVQAKLARYSAQAFAPAQTGVATERDVVQAVKTNGTQVTCTQSVNPVVPTSGPATGDRVVVIRGDLINICN